jgi:RNA polymerase sigma factor (sigma-70 family)
MGRVAGPSETGKDAEFLENAAANMAEVGAWFIQEVFPLEAALMQFLHHNWRNAGDIADLRQDIYLRVCEVAMKQIPRPAKPFVFAIARNLLIDRVRRAQIIPIDAVADLDALGVPVDEPGPDRGVAARAELRRLQAAIDRLPPRCREAVVLARIDGLTGRQIAQRMGVTESAVSHHLDYGLRALADMLYGETAEPRRPK